MSNTGAVQRYFESQRRGWRETTDPAQQERVSFQNKRQKLRARKQRVCVCISSVIGFAFVCHVYVFMYYFAGCFNTCIFGLFFLTCRS